MLAESVRTASVGAAERFWYESVAITKLKDSFNKLFLAAEQNFDLMCQIELDENIILLPLPGIYFSFN